MNSIKNDFLDEAFAKGGVDALEAACCLGGYDKYGGEVKLSNMIIISDEIIVISPPEVIKLYQIVKTWKKYAPLLWFIEQAIITGLSSVRYDLLFPICKQNQYRINAIIENYPALAKKMNFLDKDKKINNSLKEKVWQYANEEASKLYQATKKPKISQHAISKLVRTRLEKEKLYYDVDYIRSFLKSWKFTAPIEK